MNINVRLEWDYELLERSAQKEFSRGNWLTAHSRFKQAMKLLPPEESETSVGFRIKTGVKNSKKLLDFFHHGEIADALRFSYWEEAFVKLYDLKNLLYKAQLEEVLLRYGIEDDIWGIIRKKAYCPLVEKQQMGYQNCDGDKILGINYQQVSHFTKGLCAMKFNNKWTLYDRSFRALSMESFDYIDLKPNGLHVIREQDRYNILKSNGELLLPNWSDKVKLPEKESYLIPYQLKKKWGFVDVQGRWKIEPRFDLVDEFSDGCARVRLGELYGYINHKGRYLYTPTLFECKSYSEGMAPVRINKKWGFINSFGRVCIPPKFQKVGAFHEGHCPVMDNEGWKFIDKKGNITCKRSFQEIVWVEDLFWVAKLEDKYYYINHQGTLLTPHSLFNFMGERIKYRF